MNKIFKFYYENFKAVIVAAYQLMHGIWRIKRMLKGPVVTIFGGSRWHRSPYQTQAHDLAALLIEHDISVITGGGPGIMEAANCGASHAIKTNHSRARSIGISVKMLEQVQPLNSCAQEKLVVDTFLVRKWLMVNYSNAFVVFPGGFGTIDELGEVLTLAQINILRGVPIILFGSMYWQPFLDWVKNTLLKNDIVTKEDFSLIAVVDDVNQALELLKKQCEVCAL